LKNPYEFFHFKDVLCIKHLNTLKLNFEGFKENDFTECEEILNSIQQLLQVSKLQLDFGIYSKEFNADLAVGLFLRNLLKLTPNICELQTSFKIQPLSA
jgi:hypothetical protein